MTTLKERINEDMKNALRAHETAKLGAIRLLMAAIKQREIDERITLDDVAVMGIIDKLCKQRRDSIEQFTNAGRTDLADAESFELGILGSYLPQPFSAAEIEAIVTAGLSETGASAIGDLGKVMAWVKPRLAGRADMGAVSRLIRERLSAS